ncbi:hypothetical protein LINGRAHAP2_LOCUS16118 [Linum grandiflorum]
MPIRLADTIENMGTPVFRKVGGGRVRVGDTLLVMPNQTRLERLRYEYC